MLVTRLVTSNFSKIQQFAGDVERLEQQHRCVAETVTRRGRGSDPRERHDHSLQNTGTVSFIIRRPRSGHLMISETSPILGANVNKIHTHKFRESLLQNRETLCGRRVSYNCWNGPAHRPRFDPLDLWFVALITQGHFTNLLLQIYPSSARYLGRLFLFFVLAGLQCALYIVEWFLDCLYIPRHGIPKQNFSTLGRLFDDQISVCSWPITFFIPHIPHFQKYRGVGYNLYIVGM